jgi:outer membrane protein
VLKIPKSPILLLFALAMTPSMAAAEMKFGFVNMDRIENEAPQMESVRKRLEKELSRRERELKRKQDKVKKLQERLAKNGAAMSDSQRSGLERDIKVAQRDLARSGDEVREDLNILKNEELRKLLTLVGDTITELAREKKYDMIFTTGVVYASDRADVTEQVLQRLKKKRR